jgi:colanic acid/amylovoran biosynthesis glycosyltransferase
VSGRRPPPRPKRRPAPRTAGALRVAIVVDEFPALSETFILRQITGLIDRGFEVTIFANRPRPDGKLHDDVLRYRLQERTRYFGIPDGRRDKLLSGGGVLARGLLGGRERRLLACLRTLALRRPALTMELVHCARAILADGGRFDAVHCHFGPNGLRLALLKRLGLVAGAVTTTFHGYDLSTYLAGRGGAVYAPLFREGTQFLPISRFWQERLAALGCPPERTRVLRMGVDIGDFAFRARLPAADGRVRLATVGRLVEKKGVELAIRALALLRQERPELAFAYRIAGDGPLRMHLAGLVDSLGLRDCVTLLGACTGREVAALLEDSHLYLQPSVTAANGDMEGIPVSLMEAMAMGLPVLSTRHSGIPELVADGEAGYLVPERDVPALAARLADLAADPARWPAMGRAGRAAVEAEFDNDRLVDTLATLLREAAARPVGQGSA